MNGLPAIANNLASQGRYGDSMLMHVTPGEVQGLQALAQSQGASLTTNPATGLPEAFKLKDILPTLLGVGASFLLPGVAPWMIGAGVGGAEALRTGDLGRGLMAGLGAFGGAGLGTAFGAGAAGAAGGAAGGASGGLGAGLTPGAAGATGITGMVSPGAGAMAPGAANAFSAAPSAVAGATTPAAAAPSFMSRYTAAMANPLTSANTGALAGGLGVASPFLQPEPMTLPTPEDPYAKYKGPYTPSERRVSYPGDLSSSREFMYFDPSNPVPFAEGGTVDRAVRMPTEISMTGSVPEFNYGFRPVEVQGRSFDMTPAPTPIGGGLGGMLQRVMQQAQDQQSSAGDMTGYKYDPMTQSMVKMARGGSVPQLEDGGFVLTKKAVDGIGGGDNRRGQVTAARGLGAIPIKGKGHGTSDSIKTTIDGRIPARVSNGEAYVPRRAVKKAGGADKLYALMRKAERRA